MTREEMVEKAMEYAQRANDSIGTGLPVEQTQVFATLSLAYASAAMATSVAPPEHVVEPPQLSRIKEEWREATRAGFVPSRGPDVGP